MDPENPYRAYAQGEENSGLRVPDCSRPRIEVVDVSVSREESGRLRATVREIPSRASVSAVRGELRVDGVWRELGESELIATEGAYEVNIASLTDGKYTLRLTPEDAAGQNGASELVPFWIEESPFVWDDALIYLVFTDRFRNGDPTNDPESLGASRGADFEGGDLDGVTQAIEEGYFEELGVNALWLTPFNQNPEEAFLAGDGVNRVTGYHGYWPTDPYAVDERLGGQEALERLVRTAHRRGIRILMDLVVNHVHEQHLCT